MIVLSLLAVVALVAMNALFVATEFALVAARPSSLEAAAADGSGSAARALVARRDLRVQMSGAQLGITVSSIALGVLVEPTIGRRMESITYAAGLPSGVSSTVALVLVIGLAAVFQMLCGELVPKNGAIADPERTLRWTVRTHGAFVALVRPAILVVDRLATWAVRPFGLTPVDEIERAVGVPELTALLDASRDDGLIDPFEHELLTGVLDLGRHTSASVMVPRSEVVTVDRRQPLSEIEGVVASSGHTRLPMLRSPTGELAGMVHAKDLLRLPLEARDEPVPMESIRSLPVLRSDLLLDDVLQWLRRSRSQMAVVVDGTGEWVGILSMDDVVEEMVGEIRDESDGLGR